MFESIVNGHRNTTPRDVTMLALSWAVHLVVIGAVVVVPLLVTSRHLPAAPKELVTYVTVVAAPPPPPPPPAATPAPAARRPTPRATTVPRPAAEAPVLLVRQLPPSIDVGDDDEGESLFDSVDGVAGGVPGGVPGGVIGGVIGGIADLPPPPPPPAPVLRPPVRTGGKVQPPELLRRVPPVYPPVAVAAQIQGVVILEATVGRDGRVEDLRVLRSVPLLDKAAIDAVREWVYAPLLLNGSAERFVLTVTVSFSLA